MAYNPPNTAAVADLFSAADFNKYIRENFASGIPSMFTATGDMVCAVGKHNAGRIAVGDEGKVMGVSSGTPAWVDRPTSKVAAAQLLRTNPITYDAFASAYITWDAIGFNIGGFTTYTTGFRIPDGMSGAYLTLGHFEFNKFIGSLGVYIYYKVNSGSVLYPRRTSTAKSFDFIDLRYINGGSVVNLMYEDNNDVSYTLNKAAFTMIKL